MKDYGRGKNLMRVKRNKIKLRVSLHSGKKFYEENYPDVWACRDASKKDAFRIFHKKYPNAIITDYFSHSDFDRLMGWIAVDDFYTTEVNGYVYLPNKNVKGHNRKKLYSRISKYF